MSTTSRIQMKTLTVIAMSVIILVPTMAGFVTKLIEFVHTYRSQSDGVFAITPITNYLLASLGFLCLLLWATFNGMFHDIERPKYRMLDVEQELDRASAALSEQRSPAP